MRRSTCRSAASSSSMSTAITARPTTCEIGGFLLSPALRAQALASPDPDIRALADLRGRLPNSAGRDLGRRRRRRLDSTATTMSASRSTITTASTACRSAISLDPAVEAEAPRIDLTQTRVDGRAEIDTGSGFIDSVRLRGGYSDYRHCELDETGAIGTTFFNTGYEGRLEFVQSTRGGWGGGFGAQYFHRDLDVARRREVAAANTTGQFGLFALENYCDAACCKAEAACATSISRSMPTPIRSSAIPTLSRSFDAFSGSLGASYGRARLSASASTLSHTERAPSRRGTVRQRPPCRHAGFRDRRSRPRQETSMGPRATIAGAGDGYSWARRPIHSWFSDYIYEQPTGAIQDDLPVFQYLPGRRPLSSASRSKARCGSARIGALRRSTLDALADYVRATIRVAGPAPRIPPLRLLGGLEAQSDRINGRVEVEWVDRPEPDRRASRRRPTAIRWSTPRSPSIRSRTIAAQHRAVGEQHLRRRRAAGMPASSRIMPRSPAATSGSARASPSRPSLRAQAKQSSGAGGLLRRFAPRNDESDSIRRSGSTVHLSASLVKLTATPRRL